MSNRCLLLQYNIKALFILLTTEPRVVFWGMLFLCNLCALKYSSNIFGVSLPPLIIQVALYLCLLLLLDVWICILRHLVVRYWWLVMWDLAHYYNPNDRGRKYYVDSGFAYYHAHYNQIYRLKSPICVICQCEFMETKRLTAMEEGKRRVILYCGHSFCSECTSRTEAMQLNNNWLDSWCVLCRNKYDPTTEKWEFDYDIKNKFWSMYPKVVPKRLRAIIDFEK